MKIYYPILILFFGLQFNSFGQSINLWKQLSESYIPIQKNKEYFAPPTKAKYFNLDFDQLKYVLQKAPMEHTSNNIKPIRISFPLPDGSIHAFDVQESPVFAPGLAAKYPNIKSYKGIGVDNRLLSIRFDYSPNGFHGSIHTLEGKVYIDPYSKGDVEYYSVYNTNEVDRAHNTLPVLSCGYNSEDFIKDENYQNEKKDALEARSKRMEPVVMRTYRLALACTGEYGSTHGGTLELVNASFNTAINRLNQIFELENSLRMQLIELNDNLVYLDPSTDPYTQANLGRELLNQNESAFLQSGIVSQFYDVGHVFTNGCSDVGGVAGGNVCTPGKMRGVTCHFTSNIESIVTQIMAHEIGHQFTVGHSWNNCPGSEQQRSGENAYEPGSGSTIMSYAGSCGSENNVEGRGDDYYNVGSLEDFHFWSRDGAGNCSMNAPTDNLEPILSLPYTNGFYIPSYTPFELTAIATDTEGDVLTYCWEQFNLGPAVNLGVDSFNAPLIRSFPPSPSPTRVFPRMSILRNNQGDIKETLPKSTRKMDFTCVVRDNNIEGGGVVWEEVEFNAAGNAGPFRVLTPNNLNHPLEVGKYQEITWDVSNTDNAPVNCKFVDIILSVDGAFNFPDTILARTRNDGSEFIVVPDFVTNEGRLKIKASDNIFFDISNNDFPILAPSEPGYSLNVSPQELDVCLPAVVEIEVSSGSLLDFSEEIELSIIDGLPTNVTVDFNNTNIQPSENATITIDLSNYVSEDVINLTLQAVAMGADTSFRTITLNPVSNDFSDLALLEPVDGTSGLSSNPSFSWILSEDANSYIFELATNPSFKAEYIVQTESGVVNDQISLSNLLDVSTLYYWRLIPQNECGTGEASAINAFHTESLSCKTNPSEDTPINISQSSTANLVSKINIFEDGVINDINIRNLKGYHQYFSDLELILMSPDSTTVTLVKNDCGSSEFSFTLDLDQDALTEITCPPTGVFSPHESLDAFIGKSTEGIWELIIKDNNAGGGGKIEDWTLEFCANVNLSNPQLLTNVVMPVNQGDYNFVDREYLYVEDNVNPDWKLVYTLVSIPKNGSLKLDDGDDLNVGDTFHQAHVTYNHIKYTHDGSSAEEDSFLFTINDGEGGWTGTHQFNIEVVDSPVSNEELVVENLFDLFPNPTNEWLNVNLSTELNSDAKIEIFNLNGQLIKSFDLNKNDRQTKINVAELPASVYILRLSSGLNMGTKKFTIAK